MLFKQTRELSKFLQNIVTLKGILFLIFLALLVIYFNRIVRFSKENLEDQNIENQRLVAQNVVPRKIGDVVGILQSLITDSTNKDKKEELPKLVHYNEI